MKTNEERVIGYFQESFEESPYMTIEHKTVYPNTQKKWYAKVILKRTENVVFIARWEWKTIDEAIQDLHK